MSVSYWSRLSSVHVRRRRALAVSGGAVLGTTLLSACGGTSSKDGQTDKSGLLSRPVDSTKAARRGGVLKLSATADPASLDAHLSGATVATYFELAYSRLFDFKPGYLEPSQDEMEGAIAQSWEWSPDKLQLTAKLRPGVKFQNLSPINGRNVDIDDILFSWRRFSTTGSNRASAANSANPDAPILSVTAPDSATLVIKFKEPLIYAQGFLALRGYLNIVPKEAENTQVLDLRSKMLGTGPFLLADYQPSIGLTFKRHAGFWETDRPYIDQIDYPIVAEYATGLAQFRAGNIHDYAVNQEEILLHKRELPALSMYDSGISSDGTRMFWGWQAPEVRDKRVRQAFSMAIARDDWIDAQYNTQSFESQGLTIEKRWNTSLQAVDTLEGWWLDPKGKDFGPNARFYRKDIAEAKKLLAAAGYANGVEIQSNHFTTSQYGSAFPRNVETWEGMATEAGFTFKKNIVNYNSDFLQSLRDSQGKFAGISYKTGPPAPSNDAIARLNYEFSKTSLVGFHGFDVAAKGAGSGDPYVETELAKGRAEFDTDKRRAIVHELQRYLADAQYCIRWPGGATTFSLVWPAIKNYGVYNPGNSSATRIASLTWWLDSAQPPLNKT